MTRTPTCTECGRILLLSNGALLCCWRHCPAYGQDVSDDEPDTKPDEEPEP